MATRGNTSSLLDGSILAAASLTEPDAIALKGQVGVIGQIYGTVDFVIIKASVNVKIEASVGIELNTESGTDISLWIEAKVSVGVSLSINLLIITIKISFSFKTSEPHVFWWDVIATRYTGSGWSAVEVLPFSDGNLEEPSIAVVGTSVWIAAEMEHRSTSRDFALHPEDGPTSFVYGNHWPYMPQGVDGDVYVSRLGAASTAPAPELVDAPMSGSASAPLASIEWLERFLES